MLGSFHLVYDGEEEGNGDGVVVNTNGDGEGDDKVVVTTEDVNKETPPVKPTPTIKKTEGKTFTQDQVNKLIAEEKRRTQQNRNTLLNELKGLRDSVQLTEEQKQQLESRIEQLTNETLTAQQQLQRDREKLTKQHREELDKEKQSRERVWGQYMSEKITREITDAALENKAISPIQIVNYLQQNTKLVEELKDGQPTGRWVSRVSFQDKDAQGSPITLELSVTEAVKRMAEMPEHWNLFNSGVNGGLGSFNAPQTGVQRGSKPPADPVAYRKWREVNITGAKK